MEQLTQNSINGTNYELNYFFFCKFEYNEYFLWRDIIGAFGNSVSSIQSLSDPLCITDKEESLKVDQQNSCLQQSMGRKK